MSFLKTRFLAVFAFCSLLLADTAAFAQSVNIDLGDGGGSTTARIVQLILLMTVLTLAPSILIMVTSFTRIVVVFSVLRQALGTNQSPSNVILVSLALFMTGYIMAPTFEKAWDTAVLPMIEEKMEPQEAVAKAAVPFHEFMMKNVREKDLQLFMGLAEKPVVDTPEEVPLRALTPAFMISELRRAFEIGFLVYIPFLIIDMVIASTLMSMGMMMLPPTMLALPFKLIFFVIVDGWYMSVGSLIKSFVT